MSGRGLCKCSSIRYPPEADAGPPDQGGAGGPEKV